MHKRPARDAAGFTLVELLVVVVIEAMIVGALGSAFILVMKNGTTVSESLQRTNDARIAASYIVSDARNSSGPETSLSDTTSCPDAHPPVAGTQTAVVRFDWNSTRSTGVTDANVVDYVRVSNSLLRRLCVNGTLISDDAIAGSVASASAACSPVADCSGSPTKITATIVETQGSSAAPAYQYSLTGAFRTVLAIGAPLTPTNPSSLIALGTGGGCGNGATGVSLTSSSNLRVYGSTYINAVDSNCKALSLTSSATYQAGATAILSGGTCAATTGSVCPSTTSYTPAVSDPYASLAAPTTSGRPSKSGCAGGTAQPGVYAATLSLSGSSTSCALAAGIYILQNGLSVTSGATVTGASAGVFVYITGGTFSVSGTGSSVTLTAAPSGTYSGLVVWQAAADTSTIGDANSAQLVLTGAIYAPKAELSITTSVAGSSVTAVVAQSVFMTSSGKIAIGTPSTTPLSIAGGAGPTAWTVNQPYPSSTVIAAGGDGNYIWTASSLPPGITLDASSGLASGTPTATGTFNATLALNDQLGDDADTAAFTITINIAPTITSSSPLTAGEQSLPYSTTPTRSGGTAPYTWSATGLPAGLSIGSSTGTISGTPTAAATSSVSVTLTDAAGVTVTKSLSITISAAPSIISVALSNGGSTAGKLEKGDKVTIVYSAQMHVSSFCSTWSGDSTNQILNADSNVTVSISNGTTDALSVTSTSCTFNLGSINLGSSAYVTAATTFTGTSTNVSTIAWSASTHTLTITLGALKTGTVATVATSTPIYTESNSLVDPAGAAIINSPFTLAAGKQF